MKKLPSTSYNLEPSPREIKIGSPPTYLNALTGELTPPGKTFIARSKRA